MPAWMGRGPALLLLSLTQTETRQSIVDIVPDPAEELHAGESGTLATS